MLKNGGELMGKLRVYELAKELGLESKAVINWLANMGLEVKNHMSTLEDDLVEKLRDRARGGGRDKGKEHPDRDKQQGAKADQRPRPAQGSNRQGQVQDRRPQGDRPQGQGQWQDRRPQGDRPQGQGGFGQGRPDQRRDGYRPQGGGRPGGPRPQGDRPGQGRPAGGRWEAPAPVSAEQQPERREIREKPKTAEHVRSDRKEEREEQIILEKAKGQRPKKGRFGEPAPGKAPETQPKEQKPIVIGESITVKELAEKMKKPASELIKKLMGLGVMSTINQEIDSDTAEILATDLGFKVEVVIEKTDEELLEEFEDKPEDLVKRPCVVVVMGHVDHGKTSLLDAIRSTNVIATEAGGITQHIGAYQVEHNGQKITFLDTPGHEAFTAMRARGANVTDVAILVVAADDGVMPQTIEAINHAKAAKVPIIVAINKIDKPGANPDRVKQELTEHGLVAEEWGGDTICVNVSAKARMNLEEILEMILLVTEMAELKANPKRPGKGTVIEAELDKGRGPVATVLVQNGTLQVGDSLVAGSAYGKVRAMIDDKGRRVKKAGPSTPVEVLGLNDVPQAGDVFHALDDDKKARQIAEKRLVKRREEELKTTSKVTLEDLFKHIKEGEIKELNIIIKADVQGSVEAVKQSLARLSTDEVRVNPIHGGVGAITETDIMLASASNAIIIGFNVRPDNNARKAAENEQVDIRLYRVIYNAIEDVKAAMTGLLDPDIKEVILGRAEVRQTFKASKIGTIAGCYVTEGKVTRDAKVRVIRDGIVVHEGQLDSLKRFKDDAKEVAQGYECGITIDKYNDIQDGDIIEAFTFEEVKREL